MKRVIEFATESGESVLVEIDERGDEGPVRASRSEEIAEKAARTFEQALATVRPVAEAVISAVSSVTVRPDQIQVTFGVKLSANVALIAATGAEGNFEVSLTWKRDMQ